MAEHRIYGQKYEKNGEETVNKFQLTLIYIFYVNSATLNYNELLLFFLVQNVFNTMYINIYVFFFYFSCCERRNYDAIALLK